MNADNTATKLNLAEIEEVSAQLGLAFLPLPVRGPSDFPEALQAATHERAEALVVFDDTAITQHRAQLLRLAAQHALPVASIYKDFAEAAASSPTGRTCRSCTSARPTTWTESCKARSRASCPLSGP